MKCVLDNDVLLKGACYGLLTELCAAVPAELSEAGVLGQAEFVISGALRRNHKKARLHANPELVAERLRVVLGECVVLEPTDAELSLAADFERTALLAGVPLDSGESQLCAIVIVRRLPFLASGDKRAIIAIESLLDEVPGLEPIAGKLLCLEQLMGRVVEFLGGLEVRVRVCDERGVDKALSSCFSCSRSSTPPVDSIDEGLRSYTRDLRRQAPRTLAGD